VAFSHQAENFRPLEPGCKYAGHIPWHQVARDDEGITLVPWFQLDSSVASAHSGDVAHL